MRNSGLQRRSFAVLSLMLALALPSQAGPNPAPRVLLHVTVTNAQGEPVAGLNPQDFTILDNGQPQRLVSYAAYDDANKPDTPVQILLLIDNLNLDGIELNRVLQGVEDFLRRNQGQLAYPASIVILSDQGIEVPSPPTTDGNALAAQLENVRTGRTLAPLDRFLRSLSALASITQQQTPVPGRKLLLWLGPGWIAFPPALGASVYVSPFSQTSEFNDIATLLNGLRAAQITLFGGFLFAAPFRSDLIQPAQSPGNVNSASLRLSTLAFESGGRTLLNESNPNIPVADQIDQYLEDAGLFYSLAYVAPPAKPRLPYHSIQVRIDRPGLTAHTSVAYYDISGIAPAAPGPGAIARAPENPPASNAAKPQPLESISVAELQRRMRDAHKKSDEQIAVDLSSFQLSERLSQKLFASLRSNMPGPKSRQALVALADHAAFLNPPAAEIPSTQVPTLDEQQRIWSLTTEYALHQITRLPNFFATQTNTEYKITTLEESILGIKRAEGPAWSVFATSSATVYFRDGKEVLHPQSTTSTAAQDNTGSLHTYGTFGPVLATVVGDAARNSLQWSHWETGAAGQEAVFAFVVPKNQSHYEVTFRSLSGTEKVTMYHQLTPYHGTVAVDPDKGTILRLTLHADLDPGLPIQQSDLMVEYGVVQIGNKPYTCPLRGVAISTGRGAISSQFSLMHIYRPATQIVDDISFTRYHIFRTDSKIVY
jgi:VWFA-related protein